LLAPIAAENISREQPKTFAGGLLLVAGHGDLGHDERGIVPDLERTLPNNGSEGGFLDGHCGASKQDEGQDDAKESAFQDHEVI
jgi:hypothetical protein